MVDRSTLIFSAGATTAAIIVLGVACSPPQAPIKVATPPTVLPDAGKPEPVGARWALDLSDPSSASTKLALGDGSTLFVGDSGERWRTKDDASESAQTLLPEAMVAAQKTADGVRFIGRADGAVYLAKEPLGPATKLGDGVKSARSVVVGKTAILVIDKNGDLQRSVDGKTWTKVAIPQQAGVVVHIVMREAEGMLVLAPQRIYGTKDDGVTWTLAHSPGVGVRDLAIVGDAIQLIGKGSERFRFNPAWGTFTKGTAASSSSRSDDDDSESTPLELKQRLIDGTRALEIHSDSSGNDTTWTVSVGPIGGPLVRHAVPELTKCEYVDADMMGDTIEVTCDMEGEMPRPDGGLAPHSLGYVTKLLRSEDGGKSFHLDATVPGGEPENAVHDEIDAPVAIGAGGFVYLGRRCAGRECLPARSRASSSSPWVELGKADDDDDESTPLRHLRFARNGTALYSVGITQSEGQLYRWKNGKPEALGVIAHEADASSIATLSIDDDGTARGFVSDTTAFWRSFEWRDGTPTKYYDLPGEDRDSRALVAAFGGKHGFAVGHAAYETIDGGKTWAKVLAPSSLSVVTMCSMQACVAAKASDDLIGGYRIGWDEVSGKAPDKPKEPPAPQYSKPLRCTSKDGWIQLGNGSIPSIANVGHGATRWVLPVRSNGAVSLVSNGRGDAPTKTTSTVLIDAPSAKYAVATTETYAQEGGFVAVRYASVKVASQGTGKKKKDVPVPPIDVTVTWSRDGVAKIFKGVPPPLSVLTGEIHNNDYDGATWLPELISLRSGGVYFHPQVDLDSDARPLYLLRDDGKTETTTLPALGAGRPTQLSLGGTAMTLVGSSSNTVFTGVIDGRPNVVWSVSAGLPRSIAAIDLFDFGGKPTYVMTMHGGGYPASAWAIPVGTNADLLPPTALPTQKSIGDVPKACDATALADPKAVEFNAPYVHGSRHPVVVEVDGVAQVLASEHMRIRVLPSGDACVVAVFAGRTTDESDEDALAVLAFPDDIANAMLFRTTAGVGSSSIPRLSMRPLECTYVSAPLPPELSGADGFEP